MSPCEDAKLVHTVIDRVMCKLQILNLPVLSAFAGLTVGCTPFLKGLLFGPAAPFGFVKDCLEVSCPEYTRECDWHITVLTSITGHCT